MSANPHAGAQPINDRQAVADAERSGLPFLVFHDRDGRQHVFLLQSAASVGRLPTSDIAIDWDNQISRTHARFEAGPNGWIVVDDGLSSNGTFVNERRVAGTHPLTHGDRIRFGNTLATFHAPTRSPPPARPLSIELSSTQRRVLIALCRPYKATERAIPASDDAIAEELVVAAGEVRAHLRVLAAKLGIGQLPDTELRVRIAQEAFAAGLIQQHEL